MAKTDRQRLRGTNRALYFHSINSDIHRITGYLLTFRALAVEGVDLVYALAVVQTRLTGALVRVDVAEDALVPLNQTHTGKRKIS